MSDFEEIEGFPLHNVSYYAKYWKCLLTEVSAISWHSRSRVQKLDLSCAKLSGVVGFRGRRAWKQLQDPTSNVGVHLATPVISLNLSREPHSYPSFSFFSMFKLAQKYNTAHLYSSLSNHHFRLSSDVIWGLLALLASSLTHAYILTCSTRLAVRPFSWMWFFHHRYQVRNP